MQFRELYNTHCVVPWQLRVCGQGWEQWECNCSGDRGFAANQLPSCPVLQKICNTHGNKKVPMEGLYPVYLTSLRKYILLSVSVLRYFSFVFANQLLLY